MYHCSRSPNSLESSVAGRLIKFPYNQNKLPSVFVGAHRTGDGIKHGSLSQ